MFNKLLWWFLKKINVDKNKLHDLKIVSILICLFVGFVVCFVIPWLYGVLKIILIIFK